MKADCYLILAPGRTGHARIRRAVSRRPALEPDEALIRLRLELPDDIFEDPLVTIPVERKNVAVAIVVGGEEEE